MQLHVTYGKSLISNEWFSKGNILKDNFGTQICKILGIYHLKYQTPNLTLKLGF